MNSIIKIKTIIGITIAFVLGLLWLIDVLSIKGNTTEYVNTYHISDSSSHWMFKSISNYAVWNLIQVAICFVYIGFSVFSLLSKSNVLVTKILIIFEILIIIWFIRYFYLWKVSGFDHYPGFDPYIF